MAKFSLPAVLTCTVLLASGCASNRQQVASTAPSLEKLGRHGMRITTKSPDAQEAFDRGLTLAYSFGYHAAEQEFRRAATLDPDCAMAWWGVALVNGPHINFPAVPPEKARTATEAVKRAQALSSRSTPLEKGLIDGLTERYAFPQPEDRSSLDAAYAAAMRQLRADFPKSADVATLFAESLMDLHPWDYWTRHGPQPWTPEILESLEHALTLNAKHPGANHYYIHALEASPHPEKAVPAADRLRKLVPDSGHMVHMPSHIYARVGRWADAAECNREAMKADLVYRAAFPRPGFYGIYMAHNAHFLGFVAMMEGRSEEALWAAREMVKGVPPDFASEFAHVVDGYTAFVPETLMRFGRWEEILQEPEPAEPFLLARALWRFTRATALTALNRMDEARTEQALFAKAASAVPADRMMGNNYGTNLVAIAAEVLEGEMAAQEGELGTAIERLRAAVQLEDKLSYDEPPGWVQPVRHTLGAVLLKDGRAEEAEKVYRQELLRNPGNGWSLMGLRDALRMQDKPREANIVQASFKEAWASADVTPPSTCYCQDLKQISRR